MSPQPSSSIPKHSAHLGGDEPASPVGRARLIRWVGWGARITLAVLFLWAGIRKVMEPELFLQDIESYELLPYRWAWLTSIWLPFLEITAAAALLTTRRWAQAGAFLIGGMLLVFLAAIISAWARGLSLSCGCFGSSDEPANYPWLVVRDLLMVGLVGVIFLTTKHTKNTKS
jgi:putative oxidoreductase